MRQFSSQCPDVFQHTAHQFWLGLASLYPDYYHRQSWLIRFYPSGVFANFLLWTLRLPRCLWQTYATHSSLRGDSCIWYGWTVIFDRSFLTLTIIRFGNNVGFLKNVVRAICISMCCWAFTTSEPCKTLSFRLRFGCGAMYMSPALLVLIDTGTAVSLGIVEHLTTLDSLVISQLSCQSSALVSASKSVCNTAINLTGAYILRQLRLGETERLQSVSPLGIFPWQTYRWKMFQLVRVRRDCTR